MSETVRVYIEFEGSKIILEAYKYTSLHTIKEKAKNIFFPPGNSSSIGSFKLFYNNIIDLSAKANRTLGEIFPSQNTVYDISLCLNNSFSLVTEADVVLPQIENSKIIKASKIDLSNNNQDNLICNCRTSISIGFRKSHQ